VNINIGTDCMWPRQLCELAAILCVDEVTTSMMDPDLLGDHHQIKVKLTISFVDVIQKRVLISMKLLV